MKVDLPALGRSEQADVGQHLEFQPEFAPLASPGRAAWRGWYWT